MLQRKRQWDMAFNSKSALESRSNSKNASKNPVPPPLPVPAREKSRSKESVGGLPVPRRELSNRSNGSSDGGQGLSLPKRERSHSTSEAAIKHAAKGMELSNAPSSGTGANSLTHFYNFFVKLRRINFICQRKILF